MSNEINHSTSTTFSSDDHKVMIRYSVKRSDSVGAVIAEHYNPRSAIVVAEAKGDQGSKTGVYAHSETGIGIYSVSAVYAGWFQGDVYIEGNFTHESGICTLATVKVSGDLSLKKADFAEDFDIAAPTLVEAGTVMVITDEGILSPSTRAYDRRVAGVVSGAGDYQPGIILDRQETSDSRKPVALVGKVFCKVDSQYGNIETGDLLTTSDTPGYAMKSYDRSKSVGAILGKALKGFQGGKGLIPILVTLQ